MVFDKTTPCPTEGLNQKFWLVKDESGRKLVSEPQNLTVEELTPPILCKVNVDTECDQICAGTDGDRNGQSLKFAQGVDLYADCYITDSAIARIGKLPLPSHRSVSAVISVQLTMM